MPNRSRSCKASSLTRTRSRAASFFPSRNPDFRQFTARNSRANFSAFSPIRLHSVSRPHRNQAGSNHRAGMSQLRDLSMDIVPTGPRLINKFHRSLPQPSVSPSSPRSTAYFQSSSYPSLASIPMATLPATIVSLCTSSPTFVVLFSTSQYLRMWIGSALFCGCNPR